MHRGQTRFVPIVGFGQFDFPSVIASSATCSRARKDADRSSLSIAFDLCNAGMAWSSLSFAFAFCKAGARVGKAGARLVCACALVALLEDRFFPAFIPFPFPPTYAQAPPALFSPTAVLALSMTVCPLADVQCPLTSADPSVRDVDVPQMSQS